MKDKQPYSLLYRSIVGRLNRKSAEEYNSTMQEPNDEPNGNGYLGSINGRLDFISVKRTSTEATMALTHWISHDRDRRGTTLGHSSCNERNHPLDAINT
ncbi:MAG: hypothetical protein WBC91_06965 [Phototrophicaceae bacterium]